MRARLFFSLIVAAIVVAVLGISGVFHWPATKGVDYVSQEKREPPATFAILAAPTVRWTTKAQPNEHGRLHLAFKAEASAPLQSLQLQVMPASSSKGISVEKEAHDIPTWLMGNKSIDWDGEVDLTGSLMAGQPVMLQLVAVDEDHRTGTSESIPLTLPEHHFTQPLAQAIYTLRRNLQQDPGKRNEALRALAGLLQQRGTFDNQDLTLLTLRSAAVRIALDNSKEGLQSSLDLLWHAAMLFEENPSSNVTVSLHFTPKPEAPSAKPE